MATIGEASGKLIEAEGMCHTSHALMVGEGGATEKLGVALSYIEYTRGVVMGLGEGSETLTRYAAVMQEAAEGLRTAIAKTEWAASDVMKGPELGRTYITTLRS